MRSWKPQTLKALAMRDGHSPKNDPYKSLTPPIVGMTGPIYTSIAYTFNSANEAAEIFSGLKQGYAYPRISCGTPPVHQLSEKLLDLELGDWEKKSEYDVLLTGSGMSAIVATVLTLADNGGRFLSSPKIYGGTYNFFEAFLPNLGIGCTMVNNPLDIEEWEHRLEIGPFIRFLFAEDDANPLPIKLNNKALAMLAHRFKVPYVCDRTIGTPVLEQPIRLGVDVVIHSLSKNISGRSGGLGGAIIAKKELIKKIRDGWFVVLGAVLDPRVADYILDSMKDLPERMTQKLRTASIVADWLKDNKRIKKVYGPGGDLLAFEIDGTLEDARKVVESYQLIKFAPHLGDIWTLSIHPASTTHARVPQKERFKLGISDSLIRLSVGLEDPEDIIWDLDQALNKINK